MKIPAYMYMHIMHETFKVYCKALKGNVREDELPNQIEHDKCKTWAGILEG